MNGFDFDDKKKMDSLIQFPIDGSTIIVSHRRQYVRVSTLGSGSVR